MTENKAVERALEQLSQVAIDPNLARAILEALYQQGYNDGPSGYLIASFLEQRDKLVEAVEELANATTALQLGAARLNAHRVLAEVKGENNGR